MISTSKWTDTDVDIAQTTTKTTEELCVDIIAFGTTAMLVYVTRGHLFWGLGSFLVHRIGTIILARCKGKITRSGCGDETSFPIVWTVLSFYYYLLSWSRQRHLSSSYTATTATTATTAMMTVVFRLSTTWPCLSLSSKSRQWNDSYYDATGEALRTCIIFSIEDKKTACTSCL